ncbi:MAG: molybdopterin molybdenumtransferase MoeA, partial [Christensenellaceae bacterium]|nr:molybdopterin molybdenumtransferase MoeA [Christensenellaceae bacterium]
MKFFKVTKEDAARKIVGEALEKVTLATEKINLSEACSSCLAEDVFSDEKYPAYNRSTVDGYAL